MSHLELLVARHVSLDYYFNNIFSSSNLLNLLNLNGVNATYFSMPSTTFTNLRSSNVPGEPRHTSPSLKVFTKFQPVYISGISTMWLMLNYVYNGCFKQMNNLSYVHLFGTRKVAYKRNR